MNIEATDRLLGKGKRLGGLFLCGIAALGMVSCGGGGTKAPSPSSPSVTEMPVSVNIGVSALGKEIFETGDYTDELSELADDMFDAVFQTVDLNMLTSKVAYVGSGASAEQIVVAEAKDEASAGKVQEALAQKLQDDISQNEDYLPQEVSKLQKPVLVVSGNYVILCVSNDNDKIEQILLKKGIKL